MKKLCLTVGIIVSFVFGTYHAQSQTMSVTPGTLNITPVVLMGESSSGTHSFAITGTGYLSSQDIYVSPEAGSSSPFTVSLSSSGPFSSSVTYQATVGGIINNTIYVKFTPTSLGTYNSPLDEIEVIELTYYSSAYKDVRGFGKGPDMKTEGRSSGSDPWTEITDGNIIGDTSTAKGTAFGSALINSSTIDRTFQITNTEPVPWGGDLVLDQYTSSKYAQLTGTDASQFSVTAEPGTPIDSAGGTTTYTVRFAPTSVGDKQATVTIANNDPDEDPFTFVIAGTGYVSLPDAPTADAMTNVDNNSFTANWTAAVGGVTPDGYYIDLAIDAGFVDYVSGYQNLDVSNVTLKNIFNNINANTTYYLRVRAYNDGGTSNNSGTVSVTSAPSIPGISVASSITTTSFYANWSGSVGATSYKLDVNTISDFTGTAILDNFDVGNVTSYQVTSLTAGTQYYYRVRAYNGNSSENPGAVGALTYCNAPIATDATSILSTSFTANWTAPAGGTPDSYKLDVSTTSAFITYLAGYENLTVNATSISVTGLSQNIIYYYRVRSVNVSGSSNNSNSIVVQLPGTTSWTGTVNSSWDHAGNWDNGVPGQNTDVTIVTGFNQPFVNTNHACNDLTMQAGSKMDIVSGKTLTVNGDFVMESNALGSASLVEYGGLAVTGTSSVESFLTKNRWHYVSPTMSGQESGVFEGIYLKYWDEPTQDWEYITSLTYPLNDGTGYSAWKYDNDVTVTYTGEPVNQGPYNPAITYTSTGGYNLIGNPYPSAIDWDDGSWNKTNVDGTIYVWNGVQNITWNGSEGALSNGIIPMGQAFSVKANAASPAIGMTDAARGHGVDPYKEKEEVANLIEMYAYGNDYSDAAYIKFTEDATAGIDNDYDGYKRWGIDEAPQLFTVADDVNLAVNVLGEWVENMTIQLGYRVGVAGEYIIDVTNLESFVEPVIVYLEDKLTGEMINVEEQSSYTFAASPDDDEFRFELHFATIVGIDDQIENSEVYIYSSGNSVFVRNSSDVNDGTISVYDITGTEILSTQLENIPLNEIDLSVKSGYYIVKVITNNEVHSQKVFIK